MDYLNTKPIGVAEFDIYKGKLAWDKEYTRIMIEKIIQSTLELFEENNKDWCSLITFQNSWNEHVYFIHIKKWFIHHLVWCE